jgi:hypothetical protein
MKITTEVETTKTVYSTPSLEKRESLTEVAEGMLPGGTLSTGVSA